jgi:hypothetical protein
MMLTLQAQSLQIYRELARRRNHVLRSEHHGAEKFDSNESVIEIPELKSTHHCYNKRTVDRRTKLCELSYSESPEGKFIIGSDYSKLPQSTQAVFNSLLSGDDHGILFRALADLQDQIEKTSSSIRKGFEALKEINIEITKANTKTKILEQFGKARGTLGE